MSFEIDNVGPKELGKGLTKEEIKESFDKLLESDYESLADFIKDKSLLFIVNDMKRPTPTAIFLESIYEYLNEKNIDLFDRELAVIFATGTHDPPNEEDVNVILGELYDELEPKILIHRAKENDYILIGKTGRGTPIKIDKNIMGYDRIININSLEPHYFAGFTGGRKSLLPGICDWDTIKENHELALDDKSKPLSLDDNPVHLDANDAAEKIIDYLDSKFLSINSVCKSQNVYSVKTGDFFKTFNSQIDVSKDIFTSKIDKKADIVIARTAEPSNKNLYQSLKSFENSKLICKDRGVLILVSECYEGIGPRDFYNQLSSCENPKEIIDMVYEDYPFGGHIGVNILRFLENHSFYIVSELDDQIIENCFCRPFGTVTEALNEALSEVKTEIPHIVEIYEANNFVPFKD